MTAHPVRKIIPGMKIRPLNSCELCAAYEPAYIHLWWGLWAIRFLLNLIWCRCWGFSCFTCSTRHIQPGILLREFAGTPALISPDSPRIPPKIRQKNPFSQPNPRSHRGFLGGGLKSPLLSRPFLWLELSKIYEMISYIVYKASQGVTPHIMRLLHV
jgi:hypothetical protein